MEKALARHMSFDMEWSCEVYVIDPAVKSLHPDAMVPDNVQVIRYGQISEVLVWKGSANELYERNAKAAKASACQNRKGKKRPPNAQGHGVYLSSC